MPSKNYFAELTPKIPPRDAVQISTANSANTSAPTSPSPLKIMQARMWISA